MIWPGRECGTDRGKYRGPLQQNELLPSGELRYRNRVAWARFYLVREGYLDSSKRGVWQLTDRGRQTHLSPEQSQAVFQKWTKIFQKRRKAKLSEQETLPEEVAGKEGKSITYIRRFDGLIPRRLLIPLVIWVSG